LILSDRSFQIHLLIFFIHSDREFNSEAADENRKVPSPENKAKKHLKSNSLNLNKMPESGNFSSDTESKRRDSHDFFNKLHSFGQSSSNKEERIFGEKIAERIFREGIKTQKSIVNFKQNFLYFPYISDINRL